MDNAIKYTHLTSVILFMLIYIIKTVMLLMNKNEGLRSFTKMVKVPEMIVSFLFLGTGIYMLTQIPVINMFMIIKIVCVFASIPLAVIGFKKGNKALAALSLLLIIGAYGLAEISHKKMITGDVTVSGNGKDIYTANCAKCHGDDGKAGIMGAADLSNSSMDPNTMFGTIKGGKGNMTGYDGILTDAQIYAVIEYVKGLKK